MLAGNLSPQLKASAPVFAALGDEMRLRLVVRLSGGEALSITRLAAGGGITRQAVTKHLHVLQSAGLVSGSRRGREQLWELNPGQLLEAQRSLDQISRQWDEALGRLRKLVESGE